MHAPFGVAERVGRPRPRLSCKLGADLRGLDGGLPVGCLRSGQNLDEGRDGEATGGPVIQDGTGSSGWQCWSSCALEGSIRTGGLERKPIGWVRQEA
jgi:hypothetical protein